LIESVSIIQQWEAVEKEISPRILSDL